MFFYILYKFYLIFEKNRNIFIIMIMLSLLLFLITINSCDKDDMKQVLYKFPHETEPHQATWLQWPHHYQYGKKFRNRLDTTWIELTKELISSEKIYIISYDSIEKNRIIKLLKYNKIDLTSIELKIYPNDDFWVRDNGPIYVRDKNDKLVILDWGFNGWGEKAKFKNCNDIPKRIAKGQNIRVINLNNVMINEGGSIEIDGNGTLMACKSSILNTNRNPQMTQEEAEAIFTKYLGAVNFIWLDGQVGNDITDSHIDGFARFANSKTIVTMKAEGLYYFGLSKSDVKKLFSAKNKNGQKYNFLKLPLTYYNVVTSYGKDLGYKGSYCNYYIANTKVIVPIYKDPNDKKALELLQNLYPNRKVVGVDFRNVYANGGMAHCVTQQQPMDKKD